MSIGLVSIIGFSEAVSILVEEGRYPAMENRGRVPSWGEALRNVRYATCELPQDPGGISMLL